MSHFDGKTWSRGVSARGNTAVCVWAGAYMGPDGQDEECYEEVDGQWVDLSTGEPTSLQMSDDLDQVTASVDHAG